ncbi:unnamed protein product [Discula destructiva]
MPSKRNKKNNKTKGKGNAHGSASDNSARTSVSVPETPASDSYTAAAAAAPPAENNEVVDTSETTPPAATGSDSAKVNTTGLANESVPLSATPDVSADDGGNEPAFSSPVEIPQGNNGQAFDEIATSNSGSEFSAIKRDEISDAGSSAHLMTDSSHDSTSNDALDDERTNAEIDNSVNKDGGDTHVTVRDTSELTAVAAPQDQGQHRVLEKDASSVTAVGDLESETPSVEEPASHPLPSLPDDPSLALSSTTAAEGSTPAVEQPGSHTAIPQPLSPLSALLGPSTEESAAEEVVMVSRRAWQSTFGKNTTPVHGRAMAVERSTQAETEEQEWATYEDGVLLQNLDDEMRRLEEDQAALLAELDDVRREADEAHDFIDTISQARETALDKARDSTARETAMRQRVVALEAELAQRDVASGKADGGQPAGTNNPDGLPVIPPGGVGARPAFDVEVQQLRAEVQRLQVELAATQAERTRLEQRRRKATQFRAQLTASTTEKEKLANFGTAIDASSALYQTLLKLADSVDNAGPPLSANEKRQFHRFAATLLERKFVMAQAQHHDHPRQFLEPHLDAWDREEAECMSSAPTLCLDCPYLGNSCSPHF